MFSSLARRIRNAAVLCTLLAAAGCALVRTPIDACSLADGPSSPPTTQPAAPRRFEHVLVIVLENQDYAAAEGNGRRKGHPDLQALASEGVLFTNFKGLFHPSYPNYLAMVGGREFEVDQSNADRQFDFPKDPDDPPPPTIGDFLTWRNYAERYPADKPEAYKIGSADRYVRRHVPFLSFRKWQQSLLVVPVNPDTCDNAFFRDANHPAAFPQYAFYSPDMIHDGHDSSLNTAAKWVRRFVDDFRRTPAAASTLVVITFDESSSSSEKSNHIYTVFLGPMVRRGLEIDDAYNHYNVLRTIEANFGVAPFACGDGRAKVIEGIWAER